jgi:hypothetical protein
MDSHHPPLDHGDLVLPHRRRLLGAHWAYAVLGWGGYWGWDPVENASLMPWLTGTAFLHSVMMQEKRGMLKVWNMSLIFATFLLSMLGTFLNALGCDQFGARLRAILDRHLVPGLHRVDRGGLHFFLVENRSHLKSEHKLESLVSRESSFLFNNLLLLVVCFTILWGTFFPILSEFVQGHKVTVGPPFFNRVAIPVALLLLLLTAVGPLLAWRKTSIESLKRNFLFPRDRFGRCRPHDDSVRRASLGRPFLLLRHHGRRSFGAGDLHRHFRVRPRRPRHRRQEPAEFLFRHDSPLPSETPAATAATSFTSASRW